MKMLKFGALFLALTAGAAFAQDTKAAGSVRCGRRGAAHHARARPARAERHQVAFDQGDAVVVRELELVRVQQAMDDAKQLNAQYRQAMVERAGSLDARIAHLETELRVVTQDLARDPKYFDDPLSDPLRP